MPIRTLNDEEFVYVNSKQYLRIILRREQRKRLGLKTSARKEKRKYLHESRHRHACTRERGKGGRFI
jgi:nuclear transcription factor Y alpha